MPPTQQKMGGGSAVPFEHKRVEGHLTRTEVTAVLDELEESVGVVEQLSNDEVGTGIDLLLQVLHVILIRIGINVLLRVT